MSGGDGDRRVDTRLDDIDTEGSPTSLDLAGRSAVDIVGGQRGCAGEGSNIHSRIKVRCPHWTTRSPPTTEPPRPRVLQLMANARWGAVLRHQLPNSRAGSWGGFWNWVGKTTVYGVCAPLRKGRLWRGAGEAVACRPPGRHKKRRKRCAKRSTRRCSRHRFQRRTSKRTLRATAPVRAVGARHDAVAGPALHRPARCRRRPCAPKRPARREPVASRSDPPAVSSGGPQGGRSRSLVAPVGPPSWSHMRYTAGVDTPNGGMHNV